MFAICVRVCLLCRYSMRGARNFFQRGSRPDGQKTVWTTFFFLVFCFVFILSSTYFTAYRGVQWCNYKEDYTFPMIQRGSNIFQGVQLFSRGGGVQMLISIETHITCDFPVGSGPPIPLWIRTCIVEYQTFRVLPDINNT